MPFEFRPCKMEMDHKAYIRFLLQHHDGLNLPYPFAMKLGFISSPLLFGNGLLVFDEEPYEIVAAAGFVYGTGAKEYQDRHICQVEVAFIREEYRRTSLFLRGLQRLVEEMKTGSPGIEQVQFWTPSGQDYLEKLLSKLTALSGSKRTTVNDLAFYTVPFRELESYCHRFGSRAEPQARRRRLSK